MRARWHDVPLARRLVVAFVVLLTFGLVTGTMAMMVVLQVRLVDQLDEDLIAIAERLNDPNFLSQDLSSQTTWQDDVYILITRTDGTQEELYPGSSQPDALRLDLSHVDLDDSELYEHAITVSSTRTSSAWRIINARLQLVPSGETLGYVTVGLSMTSVQRTLSTFLSRVLIVDAAIITVGAVLSQLLVRTSLRPLREIEETAGAIAAGDLSRRIPTGSTTTEVGSLANSLNVMLTQIEHSFDAQRASEERMRRFVSDASHELRTPLATVRGYGELYRLGGIPPEDLSNAIGRIESEATRMSTLVNDLLQLARLDEGRAIQCSTIDLLPLAQDAVTDLKALDPTRPAKVVGLMSDTPTVTHALADEDKIRQILTNLIGNAVQHTPSGTPVEIALGTLDTGAVVLEVRDHGPGVKEEDLDRLFGRFYRTDTSRSRSSGGTGLGLAIVAAIAQAHDGTVQAVATPGGGLTVRVYLRPGLAEDDRTA